MSPLSFIIPTEDKTDYNFKTAGRLASFELRFRENPTLWTGNRTKLVHILSSLALNYPNRGVLIYLIGLFCVHRVLKSLFISLPYPFTGFPFCCKLLTCMVHNKDEVRIFETSWIMYCIIEQTSELALLLNDFELHMIRSKKWSNFPATTAMCRFLVIYRLYLLGSLNLIMSLFNWFSFIIMIWSHAVQNRIAEVRFPIFTWQRFFIRPRSAWWMWLS